MHGVSLKYLGVSAVTALAAHRLSPPDVELLDWPIDSLMGALQLCLILSLWNMSLVNGAIAALFNLQVGMTLLGKDADSGQLPMWSYFMFASFHTPTYLYTRVQRIRDGRMGVAVADEVEPGWWVGGRYAHELGRRWAGTIDLTCEFPETCAQERYMLLRCWDGVPPTPEQLEAAASFALQARLHGDVLVHCAHGRGRSTTTMCACLVKAGLHPTWEAAFNAVKKRRPVCKLNRKMQAALTAWQEQYSTKKK